MIKDALLRRPSLVTYCHLMDRKVNYTISFCKYIFSLFQYYDAMRLNYLALCLYPYSFLPLFSSLYCEAPCNMCHFSNIYKCVIAMCTVLKELMVLSG